MLSRIVHSWAQQIYIYCFDCHYFTFNRKKSKAPEVLEDRQVFFNSDLWSVGVVYYLMLFDSYPFDSYYLIEDIKEKTENKEFDID